MTDILEALRREIDEAATRNDDPVRIRVTRAAVPGTLLIMPEDVVGPWFGPGSVSIASRAREIRVHPDDWWPRFATGPETFTRIRYLWGLPVFVEQGCEPNE